MFANRSPVAALALMLLVSCRFGGAEKDRVTEDRGPSSVKPGFNLLSPAQDIEIGKQSAREVEQQLPLLSDPKVTAYVRDLGARLVENAVGPEFPYQFHVIDASDLNAFALPGGPIYINRGVLESAKSEGEVAGVLAHEIAHVALRHGTHNVSKAYLTQAGIGLLGGLLGRDTNVGAMIQILGGFGLNALFLKYSRSAETQADVAGLQILSASGFEPEQMIEFFRTLQQSDTRKTAQWLSDHPSPENRIQRLTAEAKRLTVTAQKRMTLVTLAEVQKELRAKPPARTFEQIAGMRGPTSSGTPRPRSNARVTVPAPSSTFARYRSPSSHLQISYPSNWKVYEGGGDGVTFAPEGGAGEINGGVEIVYGAMVNHYAPFNDDMQSGRRTNLTIDDATADLVQQIRESSRHLAVKDPARGDGNVRTVVLRGVSPNTSIDEQVNVVIKRLPDGHFAFLIFVTPTAEATAYRTVFNEMMQSLGDASRT